MTAGSAIAPGLGFAPIVAPRPKAGEVGRSCRARLRAASQSRRQTAALLGGTGRRRNVGGNSLPAMPAVRAYSARGRAPVGRLASVFAAGRGAQLTKAAARGRPQFGGIGCNSLSRGK